MLGYQVRNVDPIWTYVQNFIVFADMEKSVDMRTLSVEISGIGRQEFLGCGRIFTIINKTNNMFCENLF